MSAPLSELLARYAAGQLALPLHVLVASHLELRQTSQTYVTCMESLSAHAMECCEPAPLAKRQACLDRIFASNGGPQPAPMRPVLLPRALQNFIGGDFETLKWRRRLPGLREYTICDDKTGEANLYLIRGGCAIPAHTHEGNEITLVLKGSFSDQTGTYKAGDIAIADASLDHRPVAGCGEECLCYSVLDAPLHLTGPFGRILDRFF